MKRKIPIGIKEYSKLKLNDYYAVDKSLMIEEFINNGFEVTLITRPRRFGKTLNLSMLAEFFDITKDSSEIFRNTDIAKRPCYSEINQYPVIFISFADAKGKKDVIVRKIKEQLRNEYDRYNYIFDNLSGYKKDDYNEITKGLTNKNDGELDNVDNALSFLSDCLESFYHQKPMIFIDEYDTPFIEAYIGGFYDKINSDLSLMLQSALKSSDSFKYAMLTGIQRVAKESIFSGLNNIKVYTVNNEGYSKYFGFTEDETQALLEYYDLKLDDEVKAMYDGYRFGNQEIYNPWSILNYAADKIIQAYWINTSANRMIIHAMQRCGDTFKRSFDELIEKGMFKTSVNLNMSFYEDEQLETLWGLFINAGYLTIEKEIMEDYYLLKIPNNEVKKEFVSLTANRIEVSSSDLKNLYLSLQCEDKNLFMDTYQSIMKLPSFHDLLNENSYHMIMLGLSAGLSNDYKIISNREAGLGRCDIVLDAKRDLPSYVIEFKYTRDKKESLEALANKAIKQIVENRYDEDLKAPIVYIGIGHHSKNVFIKWVKVKK